MLLAITLNLHDLLPITTPKRANVGSVAAVEFPDRPVRFDSDVVEVGTSQLFAVDEQPRRLAASEQKTMLARWKDNVRMGSQQKWRRPRDLHTTLVVASWKLWKREQVRRERFAKPGDSEVPSILVGDILKDLDQHFVRWDNHRRQFWRGVFETSRNAFLLKSSAMNRDLVDPSEKRTARVPTHGGANPHLVIVHLRSELSVPAEVPAAFDSLAVDVSVQAGFSAEFVRNGNVVPTIADSQRPD